MWSNMALAAAVLVLGHGAQAGTFFAFGPHRLYVSREVGDISSVKEAPVRGCGEVSVG